MQSISHPPYQNGLSEKIHSHDHDLDDDADADDDDAEHDEHGLDQDVGGR